MFEDQIWLDKIIGLALDEDLYSGDLTTEAIIDPDERGRAVLEAREPLILAGLPVFHRVFNRLDDGIEIIDRYKDGQKVKAGDHICSLEGSMRTILKGERTALNFIQRMSGIATLTNRYIEQAGPTKARITDTRKTVPGHRMLDKYAVRMGGGSNHRMGLFDGILIKDNHIAAAGSIGRAVGLAREKSPHTIKIEVEVEDLAGVEEAVEAGADIVLLDNMGIEELKMAVELVDKRAVTEASGGITLDNINGIAKTGVDIISVGALTHSAVAVDMSLEVTK